MKRFPLVFLLMLLLAVSVAAQETLYTAQRGVRVREEPSRTATVETTLRKGVPVSIIETAEGESVSGSTLWYKVNTGMYIGYIHSSLLTSTGSSIPATSGSSGGSSGGSSSQLPDQQSTPVPLAPPVVPDPPQGAACNGARTCSQMASCEQAYACLNAGRASLDRDKDGVPCEDICPGG